MKKHALKIAAVVLLSGLFLFLFFRSVDWRDVLRSLTEVNPLLFALSVPLGAAHFLTRALRWKYLLAPEKKGIRYGNLVAGNAVGFTVSVLFPGRVGEVVKPLYVARKEKIRPGYAVGTIVVERVFDMFTMCSLLALFLLARPLYADRLPLSAEALGSLAFWGKVGAAVSVGILAVIMALYFLRDKAVAFVARLLRRAPEKIAHKVLTLLHEFMAGLRCFRSIGSLGLLFLLSLLVWLGIVVYYWVFIMAYRVPAPFVLVIPYVFLTGIGASIPTPGMVGGYDYFSKLGLTLLFGLDASRAVALTLVSHASQVVVTCLIGYAILAKEGLSLFQLRRMGENTNP